MRSLARGLNVLDYIVRQDGVTLTQIVDATGLSKAVVHRILQELMRTGFAWRSQGDKRYRGAPLIAATPGGTYTPVLLSAAAQPMRELVAAIKWPSDLFIREGTQMVMVESSRPSSPYHLRWSRIGRRAPILLSSVGRAVLAAMSDEQRKEIYEQLREDGEWKSQLSWLPGPIETIIAETRKRGFAEREVKFAGPVLERRGEHSIGVSIVARGTVIGAINVWWPSSADPGNAFTDSFLPLLRHCKTQIEANLLSEINATPESASTASGDGCAIPDGRLAAR